MPDDKFFELSDEDLVRKGNSASGGGQVTVYDGRPDPRYRIEMMRRLMLSINKLNKSTTASSYFMGGLTIAILVFTIAMWVKMG